MLNDTLVAERLSSNARACLLNSVAENDDVLVATKFARAELPQENEQLG
jgi:hypothetical protein